MAIAIRNTLGKQADLINEIPRTHIDNQTNAMKAEYFINGCNVIIRNLKNVQIQMKNLMRNCF